MIDTHAHVHDKKFDDDRAAVIDRARTAEVTSMITVGCDVADSFRGKRHTLPLAQTLVASFEASPLRGDAPQDDGRGCHPEVRAGGEPRRVRAFALQQCVALSLDLPVLSVAKRSRRARDDTVQ